MRLILFVVCSTLAALVAAQQATPSKKEAKVRAYLARDKPYKAIRQCTDMLARHPDPVYYVLRADAHNRIGEFSEAESDALQGSAAMPGDREALLQLAIAERGLGKYDSAIARYRGILDQDSARKAVSVDQMDTSGSGRNGVSSGDIRVLEGLALSYQAKKDYDHAIVHLRSILEQAQHNGCAGCSSRSYQRVLAECLAAKGDPEGSRAAFELALQDAPNDPIVLNSRGWFLFAANGDHVNAIKDYDRAIKQNPNYSYAFNNRGWSKFKIGDTSGALKDINLARKKKPFNPYIYRNLGCIALEHGDTEEACAQFRHALDLNFTAVYGDEVERLVLEHCRGKNAAPKQDAPAKAPEVTKPKAPPTRTNAPE